MVQLKHTLCSLLVLLTIPFVVVNESPTILVEQAITASITTF